MKTLLIILLSITFHCISQEAEYGKLDKKSKYTHYISKSNDTIKVGSKINILDPSSNVFTYISQNNIPAGPIIAGTNPEITKIKSFGTKKRGYKVYVGFSGYGLTVWIDYENALRIGEISIN